MLPKGGAAGDGDGTCSNVIHRPCCRGGSLILMGILESHVDRQSSEFQANSAYFQELLAELHERIEQVQQGGGPEAIARHRNRNKLLARERVQLLCDPDTPF